MCSLGRQSSHCSRPNSASPPPPQPGGWASRLPGSGCCLGSLVSLLNHISYAGSLPQALLHCHRGQEPGCWSITSTSDSSCSASFYSLNAWSLSLQLEASSKGPITSRDQGLSYQLAAPRSSTPRPRSQLPLFLSSALPLFQLKLWRK